MTENSGRSALFFDVDGTLLNDAHELPASAREAIAQARERGHLVFINSGRMSGLLKQLQEELPVDGVLCGCGTEIIVHGRQLYYYRLSEELRQLVRRDLEDYNVEPVLEGREGCYFRPGVSRFPQVERTKHFVGLEGGIAPEPYDGDYELSKFCIQADEASDVDGFKREFSKWFDVIDRGGGFYECVPYGHSKGTAILKVLKHCGVGLENSYVFGDSTNDIGMFKVCRNCIAMARHDKELEPYATFVTKDVDEDGVAFALRHFGLIG